MTSTSISVGFSGQRNTSKVLKPPGGGTSELFTAPTEAESPRRVRNAAQPSMILPLGDASPIAETDAPSYKPGNQTHSRLFGGSEPSRNYRQQNNASSIVLGDDRPVETAPEPVSQEPIETKGEGDSKAEDSPAQGGNPVTGEGYESPKANGVPARSNGASSPANPVQLPAPRNRVPPGGFSSGLW